jgi:hypothetical protein
LYLAFNDGYGMFDDNAGFVNVTITLGTIPPATVTIRGTVYDNDTNQPLADANVVATGPKSTRTDANGQFEITGLSPGQINVQATKTNYGDSLKTLDNAAPGQVYPLDFSIVPDVKCGFLPSENGFHFDNPSILVIGGLCGGMTYTALECYLYKIKPGPALLKDLWLYPIAAAHGVTMLLRDIALVSIPNHSLEENINFIRKYLQANVPCPISLAPDGIWPSHSVLAYKLAVESQNNVIKYKIFVYDNNKHDNDNCCIVVICDNGMWHMDQYDEQYNRLIADFILKVNIGSDLLKDTMGFLETIMPTLKFIVHSPVSLQITTPDGFVIDNNSVDEEGMYYRILDTDGDGYDEQIVLVLAPKEGKYDVVVIPDSNAEPNATFTLEEHKFGKATIVAQDVPISEIPPEPYRSIVVLPALTCEQALVLLDYNLVDQNRISRTEFEYTFSLRVANSWIHDINDITIRIIQEPNNTTVLDDTVHFDTIQAGTEALSDDTFKIRTDRTIEGLKSDVVWKVCDCKMERKTDFNHDWVVNFLDFATFAQAWLSVGTDMPQDVYPDGKVDIMDLGVFSDEWLK